MDQSKKIEISKSTLISLKAELLRKKDEVEKAKLDPKNKAENFIPTSKFAVESEEESKVTSLEGVPEDINEKLKQSRDALEKKALIYEHYSKNALSESAQQLSLVDFEKKKQIEVEEEIDFSKPDNTDEYDDEDEWVDYVDCLGRTRRCHKSDLSHVQMKDSELKKNLHLEEKKAEPVSKTWVKEGEIKESSATFESPDAYKELLRQQWEEKERELMKKDTVHYQDLLFNESRSHGVGFYNFSSDEAERYKQQSELKNAHKQTEEAQKKAAEARAARDAAMQRRVAAARARQRARANLPPEEETPKEAPSVTEKLLDFVVEQKKEFTQKAEEEAKKKRDEEAQKEREKYVREWDVGKERLAKQEEMTQEEWVSKKRKERPDEFAPVENFTSSSKRNTKKDAIKSKYYDPTVNEPSSSSIYPTPIVNECDDDDDDAEDVRRHSVEEERERGQGIEIEPPPSYEYYGPVDKKVKRNTKEDRQKVVDAFEQGVKCLEEHTESRSKKKNKALLEFN